MTDEEFLERSAQHQHPGSKFQSPLPAEVEAWGLELLWSLDVGAWNFSSCGYKQLKRLQFAEGTFQIFRDECGHPGAALAAAIGPRLLQLLKIVGDRKSTRLNSSHSTLSRMPSSA